MKKQEKGTRAKKEELPKKLAKGVWFRAKGKYNIFTGWFSRVL